MSYQDKREQQASNTDWVQADINVKRASKAYKHALWHERDAAVWAEWRRLQEKRKLRNAARAKKWDR